MAVSDNNRKGSRAKATSAADWKKTTHDYPILTTPTGKNVRVKRPGMTKFLEAGYLPDALAATVRKEIAMAKKRPGPARQEVKVDLFDDLDPEALAEMLASLDKIMCHVFVEPKCVTHRRVVLDDNGQPVLDEAGEKQYEDIPEEEREDGVIYPDWIEMEDKNFIFQYAVGGSSDLTRFRQEQNATLAALAAKSGVEATS